ncbi:MAG: tetratricopeptide repeat protein [Oligoflexales bacterium]|nr:tetratricopeptide repeat protein [Oligoflexales bacterium]
MQNKFSKIKIFKGYFYKEGSGENLAKEGQLVTQKRKRMLTLFLLTYLGLGACQNLPKEKDLELLKALEIPVTESTMDDESKQGDVDTSSSEYAPYLFSESLALNSRVSESEPLLKQAYAAEPNAALALKLLYLQISQEKHEEAFEFSKKTVLLYPKSPELHLVHAHLLAKFNLYEEAVEQAQKSIEVNPQLEAGHSALVSLYLQKSNLKEAEQVAKNMTRIFPKSILGWTFLSKIHLSDGKTSKAKVAIEKAFRMSPDNLETALTYAFILELNNETKAAVKIYDEIFSKNLSFEELISQTLVLFKTFGSLDITLTRLNQISRHMSPKVSFGIEAQKLFILWEQGQNEEAIRTIQTLLKSDPSSSPILYLSALGYERIKDEDKALALYEKIEKGSPFSSLAHYRRIQILMGNSKFDAALLLLEELLQSGAETPETYLLGAQIYGEMKNYKKAIEVLKTGQGRFPHQVKLLFVQGIYEEKNGDTLSCMNTMRTVILQDPSQSSAMNYLGYLLAERGENLDLAEKLLQKALVLKPKDGLYLDSLGWIYYKKGDLDKAQDLLEQAIEIEANEPALYEHLADLYLKKKNVDKARQYLEEALTRKLEKEDLIRLEKKLNSIPKK